MKAAAWMLASLVAGFSLVAVPNSLAKSPPSGPRDGTVLEAATDMCRLISRSRFVHQCDVTGWLSSIDVTIPLQGQDADNACRHTRNFVSEHTDAFKGKDWRVRIISPLKSNGATATCPVV
jgi:hypothetical protein